jgi:hypothetical protein
MPSRVDLPPFVYNTFVALAGPFGPALNNRPRLVSARQRT